MNPASSPSSAAALTVTALAVRMSFLNGNDSGGRDLGNLVRFSSADGDFLIDYPVVRTSIQPNEFALNAVNPDNRRGSNDQNARSEEPPHEPILFGAEEPGAQYEIDLAGDLTVLPVPEFVLKPGQTYRARVRHWNDAGLASPWSEEQTFTVNPIASETVLEEDFNGDYSLDADLFDKVDFAYDQLETDGWQVSWQSADLGITQLHLNSPQALDNVETDGRGINGHFQGGVLHAQDPYVGTVTTPSIDNSGGDPLTLIFDSAWRTGVQGNVNVIIGGETTTIQTIGQAYILQKRPDLDNGSGGVVGSDKIYNNTYVLPVPETAGEADVQFQWEFIGGNWWTIDNVQVVRGAPTEVKDWYLF